MTAKGTLPDPKVNTGPNTTEEPKRTFHFLPLHRWLLNKRLYERHYVSGADIVSLFDIHFFANLIE